MFMEYIFKPLKTTLKIFATFLIILFIFFTTIETSLYWTNYSPSYFSYNSSQVHKSCDFNVKYNMNNLGFREEDFDFSKPNKKTKIIMIGDSMIMGHGVKESDTIPRILEKKLRANNHDSQVVNLGLSAANPSLYSQVFRFIALRLKPDIVIVNYYSGNDPQEMVPYAKQNQTYKYIRNIFDRIMPRTLSFLNKRVSILMGQGFFSQKKELVVKKCLSLKDQALEILKGPNDFIFLNNPEYQIAVQRINSLFIKMQEECEKRGIKFYVNNIDSFIQTRPKYWKLYAEAKAGKDWFSSHQGPYKANHKFLDELHTQKNISLIKPLNELWRYTGESLYYEHDGHLNPRGTKLVANTIYKKLDEEWRLIFP